MEDRASLVDGSYSANTKHRMKSRTIAAISLFALGLSCWAEIPKDFVLGGIPRTNGLVAHFNITVITNVAYVTGYDETRKEPAWVGYKLVKRKPAYKLQRPDIGYPMDDKTLSKVPANAYSLDPKDPLIGNTKWEHGHMAANDAIAKVFGQEAQLATFKMSNMCPQSHRLNGGKWKVLESREYKYSQKLGETWTVCGPLFEKKLRTLKCGTEVPSGFYKILVRKNGDELEAMAITFEFYPRLGDNPTVYLKAHLTTIRELERRSGLDFFPALPQPAQDLLETTKTKTLW